MSMYKILIDSYLLFYHLSNSVRISLVFKCTHDTLWFDLAGMKKHHTHTHTYQSNRMCIAKYCEWYAFIWWKWVVARHGRTKKSCARPSAKCKHKYTNKIEYRNKYLFIIIIIITIILIVYVCASVWFIESRAEYNGSRSQHNYTHK